MAIEPISPLENVLRFFEAIGIYRVVLPFLLTFAIVFAILERTRVLGTERIGKEEYTKKNLNAIVAFVIALFVIASSQIVGAIARISAQIVIVFLLGVLFLALVGTFYARKEEPFEKAPLHEKIFVGVMILGIVIVFLNGIQTPTGVSWLQIFIGWISQFWISPAVASIILLVLIILFISWITKPEAKKEEK